MLRIYDVAEKLSRIESMSNVGADRAAEKYVLKPDSSCGKLTLSALEGNPDAKKKLTENWPDLCGD